jgi:hypothetical protein
MKHVILIHAHKDLGQLNALVGQLAHADFLIYVNVDARSGIDVTRLAAPARLVRRRIPIHWGGWSQVRAILNSLAEILDAVPDFGKVVLISAQDFPLLSNQALQQALEAWRESELIDCIAAAPEGWACQERYQYFHFRGSARCSRVLARAMRLLGLRRKMPRAMRAYAGSSWWALSRPCLEAILHRVQADPSLARFFSTVASADELFFQTLVMDSPFAPKVVAKNFRYVIWPDAGACHPKILDAADFPGIARSGAHFCRKLDPLASAELLPMLEQLRQQRI